MRMSKGKNTLARTLSIFIILILTITMAISLSPQPVQAADNNQRDLIACGIEYLSTENSNWNNYTYTGQAIIPSIAVHDYSIGKVLEEGTDYTLTCENNTNAGQGTATMTLQGIGEYTGTKTETFNITPKTLTAEMVEAVPDQTYTGKEILPKLVIRDVPSVPSTDDTAATGDVPSVSLLTPGIDYEVRSQSNSTNVGAAQVAVVGKGNYQGYLTVSFKIVGSTTGSSNGTGSTTGTGSSSTSGTGSKPTTTPTPENTQGAGTNNGTPGSTTEDTKDTKDTDTTLNRNPAGALHVTGPQLLDANNTPVQLRGVSTHGIAWYPDYISKAAFQTLRDDWGANLIRLAMYTQEYNGYCAGGDHTYLEGLIDKGVKAASDLGMYVIIDWHILSDGSPVTHQADAIDFFTRMSAKYKGYNNVLYEICNEPNNGTTWSTVRGYANKVIPAIRKNDPNAIIIVGTPTWSQDVDQVINNQVSKPKNVMYTLHFYAGTHGQYLRDKAQKALNNGIPIFITEFSICDASGNGGINYTEADKWAEFIRKNKLSFAGWSLSNKQETSALIKSSVSKTSGWTESDLSDTGLWLRKLIKSQYVDKKAVEEFVTRLYDNMLGRKPDKGGFNTWVNYLCEGHSGAQCVQGFVFSKELQAMNLTNEEYVRMMYKTILGREADKSGLKTWVGYLDAGCTRKLIFQGFIGSTEFKNQCAKAGINPGTYTSDEIVDKNPGVTSFVSRLYTTCLGRKYDRKGLADWTRYLIEKRVTAKQAADGFYTSKEFRDKHLTDEEFVKNAYATILDRQPDKSGLKTWTTLLAKGKSRQSILDGFYGSKEFTDLCAKYGIKNN